MRNFGQYYTEMMLNFPRILTEIQFELMFVDFNKVIKVFPEPAGPVTIANGYLSSRSFCFAVRNTTSSSLDCRYIELMAQCSISVTGRIYLFFPFEFSSNDDNSCQSIFISARLQTLYFDVLSSFHPFL